MKFGYATVKLSTQEDITAQVEELRAHGAEEVVEERMNPRAKKSPKLQGLLLRLRRGDVLVVCQISRLANTVKRFLEIAEALSEKGVSLFSLREGFDSTAEGGQMTFRVLAALAQIEREAAATRNKPPPADKGVIDTAIVLHRSGKFTLKEIAETTGVSITTLYRYLDKEANKNGYGQAEQGRTNTEPSETSI